MARRHLRMFAGAPDLRRQAGLVFSALALEGGWNSRDREMIHDLGEWLATRPPLSELRARCENVVTAVR